jgi:hypothetical protein
LHRTTDHDFPTAYLDVESLAIVEPGGPHGLARQPNGEAFSPFADDDSRQRFPSIEVGTLGRSHD